MFSRVILFVFMVILYLPTYAYSLDKGVNLHHIFPQEFERKYLYWSKHNISHHLYCVPLTPKVHARLHNFDGGKWYNNQWEVFIKSNPVTDKEKLFAFAGSLLTLAGITNALDLYDFKSRTPTGKKLNPKKLSSKFMRMSPKFLNKIARPIQYVVLLYEGGQVIEKHITTGEVDTEYAVTIGARAIGGLAGADLGATLGSIACTPALSTGPGYVVCVGAFSVAGAVAGEETMKVTTEFIIENVDEIERRLFGVYTLYSSIPDSVVFDDLFDNNIFVNNAITKRNEALILQAEGKYDEAGETIGDAQFYLAYALFNKSIKYKTEAIGSLVDLATAEGDRYTELAIDLFKKSIILSPENEFSYYLLAESFLLLKQYARARHYYVLAKSMFSETGRKKYIDKVNSRIEMLDGRSE